MPRHCKARRSAVDVARARHPAVLGGVIGGAVALALGVGACAFVAGSDAGVHFSFGPEPASAAIVDSRGPAVMHDGASATASSTPTADASAHSAAASASSVAASSAQLSGPAAPSSASAAKKATSSTSSSKAAPVSSASPKATPTPTATPTAAAAQPSATPSATSSPTPTPSTGSGHEVCLGSLCVGTD